MVYVVFKSISLTLSSFGGNFHTNVISGIVQSNSFLKFVYLMHYIFSMVLTFLVVIKLFGKNVINEVRVYLISRGKKYIVTGFGSNAKIFLGNIGVKQRQRTIVILEPGQKELKKDLMFLGYAVVVIKEEVDKESGRKDVYKAAKLALIKAGAMRCSHQTNIISMSENDETNLLIAKILTEFVVDEINLNVNSGRIKLTGDQEEKLSKIKLDARIMYKLLERAEHFSFIENALGRVRFFNPHEIMARKFIWDNPITKLIPFHWIDTEKARLKNNYKINNIFVGFDLTNKAILKASIINNQLLGVDYNAAVICDNAKKLEKQFKIYTTGLFDEIENGKVIKRGAELKPNPDGKAYFESPQEINSIVFKDANVLSADFFDIVINEVKLCNYATVIIALGDDKLGIETALELRQKLYEADLLTGKEDYEYQRIKIFVKITEETVFSNEDIVNRNAAEMKNKIIVFGADSEILNHEYIINEKLDILAKNMANRYEGNVESATAANEWNTCTQFQRESNRSSTASIRTKLNLMGLDVTDEREPGSDYSDAFRKQYGTGAAFTLRGERKKLEREIKLAREEEKKGRNIPEKLLTLKVKDEIVDLCERKDGDFADVARNNLARMEHQRWNAFYLANDWTKLPREKTGAGRNGRQNGLAKQHACITTFHGLVTLREAQKEAEKVQTESKKEKQYIEAESLLNADTIRHDFFTMDYLIDLCDEDLAKLRDAEGDPDRQYVSILAGSPFGICKIKNEG
jgi:hypothetical protein